MKTKAKKRINTFLILIFAAAVVGLYIYLYLIPNISGALTPTVVAEYGEMHSSNPADCLVIRDEQVIYAEQGGTISYYAGEGEKTRVNAKILDVYPAGQTACSYYCPVTGFVSYYLDGYEEFFDIESVIQLEPEYISQSLIAPEDSTAKSCQKGDPLYKLISSDEWHMVLAVDKSYADSYLIGQSVNVIMSKDAAVKKEEAEPEEEKENDTKTDNKAAKGEDGDPAENNGSSDAGTVSIPASVENIFPKDNGVLVVVKTRRYFEDFAKLRFTRVSVITQSFEGLVIPQTSVTEVEGVQGVYKLTLSGEYRFVPVQILTQNEENYLVEADVFTRQLPDGTTEEVATIGTFDEILRSGEDGI